ncbi:hypothetical protein ScPMuIL_015218 [Solemya velum]
MTDYTKSQAFMEYKLRNLQFLLERTESKYTAEVKVFRAYRELYQNNKTQLAQMEQCPSEIDGQFYDFICLERDENKRRAQLSQTRYRSEKEVIDTVKALIGEIENSIKQTIEDSRHTALDGYERLLNLCRSQERELLSLKEKYDADANEMNWLIGLQHEAKTCRDVKFFGKIIRRVETRREMLDAKYKEALQMSLCHKQDLIEKSVNLITQWIEGDMTGMDHVVSLWDKCIDKPIETTDVSISTIIRKLVMSNLDLFQCMDVAKIHETTQKSGCPVQTECTNRGWGDVKVETDDKIDSKGYESHHKTADLKDDRHPQKLRSRVCNAKLNSTSRALDQRSLKPENGRTFKSIETKKFGTSQFGALHQKIPELHKPWKF